LNALTSAKASSGVPAIPHRREIAVALVVFLFTFAIRAWGISTRFQLLGDQIRDWEIALQPFTSLPLVGPPTHVHGYTLGPAFYWILWAIRVTVGPWFHNLPHAGGIGQALLQSAADALLLVAIWRRIGSMWVALAVILFEAAAPFDLSLAAVVWNPTMGSMLAKVAIALTLFTWHRGSTRQAASLFAVAWTAVHAYTGAIYVTAAVFATALLDPILAHDRKGAVRNAVVIAAVVAALQVPYFAYQIAHPGEPAMAAVTGSVADIISGRATVRLSESVAGYVRAVNGIEIRPWAFGYTGWLLVASGVVVAVRYRRDVPMLMMTIFPTVLAIVGYAFFLSALDNYYYFSLMPSAVLMVVLALTAISSPRVVQAIGILLVIGALAIVPARRRDAMTIHQMGEYGVIVHASRVIVDRGTAVRAIRLDFPLPPTNDPEFVYRILGGRLDPQSPWVAVILRSGDVTYRNLGQS
jgi:hypothetical protein